MRESGPGLIDLNAPRMKLRRKWRHASDNIARVLIAIGGVGVIVAILLIFAYLFYEVVPLFRAAQVNETATFDLPVATASEPLHLAIEEQAEIAMRLDQQGVASFYDASTGEIHDRLTVSVPDGTGITAFALDAEESGIFALGLSDGSAVVAQYSYATSFAQGTNSRVLTPRIEYPFGEDPFALLPGAALETVAVNRKGDNLMLLGVDNTNRVNLLRVSQQTGLFAAFDGGGASVDIQPAANTLTIPDIDRVFIGGDQNWVYLISRNGLARVLSLAAAMRGEGDSFASEVFLTPRGAMLSAAEMLLGGISLLVADDQGGLSQWFVVQDDAGASLQLIRRFEPMPAAIVDLTTEQRNKNFVAVDAEGTIAIYNTTATRRVFSAPLLDETARALAISPRGDALLGETVSGEQRRWEVHNEHPEVSWSVLWDRVWYEGYPEPDYIWQSSASSNDFESKYSLVPLSFGTLKAAFYAMLLAAPLAICGAIFTGYFMAGAMRRKVKPLIELMEALPTVVLGFLAGLWLAPFVERNLLGIFAILILLPLGILLASFGWAQMPRRWRQSIPDGWEAALLIPVILLFGYLSFALATPIEATFFAGDMRGWITTELGITYDQRNALVVGFAMGFAVIPTIFSIAEDAIFTVPKQLTYGSLALGATPWQSLYRVVLPTASPGIFSGLMIGMGRAVGETMIVLMATGNTPIMDINIFEGMRTLAANIAVEIPESEVDSTHYRILFLAALVLFLFTFTVNTVAELVRQRLRSKYSTI
ncbi:MAG: ABC transporter permease subunit [Pseudohongiellaceae bacterium]